MADLQKTLSQEEMDDIIYEARAGDLDSLKEIFEKHVDPQTLLTIKDEYTLATPIHMAAANGHDQVCQYLLRLLSKGDAQNLVNKQNESGNTALHWAAYNGHTETIKVLCEFGADPFLKNKFNHDAIYEAEKNNKSEVEKYFLEKFDIQQDDDEPAQKVQYKEGTEIEKATEESREVESICKGLKANQL
ncbi:hypothetical protein KL918_000730 [Ogataea parapolymorpha]|uniref:Ankyrin repeat-containing protein YAR1 n=1 Tax=Ogataea parapolymorpha (strain ATCC 26012 / BCRC 20466 / JCM 22074 / NRRL Y-7560 / DL-1) TaxID=871575 RepID=W1Q8I7_OGAPD|nr:Ankyrin repeat-containing protein YAR1 [Ogataea parapolymorpha DL-1]ESW97120.1 Ankyrin repeat-containing protein YAR1 [Ogataea parapolymorpha DL-1]KAG7869185.1 hypothetical protein KL918_000730 [Ogataea parapolymorpha]KAG7875764.1 hypothetical protein KL916_000435 [Ogataea parapolymorpha]